MNFDDWLVSAVSERSENLHEFNALFEQNLAASCEDISLLREAFTNFLVAHLPMPSDSADGVLQEFCGIERTGRNGVVSLPAFQGPAVDVGDRELSAQKSFRGVDSLLRHDPRLQPGVALLEASMLRAPKHAPSVGTDIEKRAWIVKWDNWVDDLTLSAQAVEAASVPSVAPRRLLSGGRRRTAGRPRATGGDRKIIFWLTFSDAVDGLLKMGSFLQSRLGHPNKSATRSFLAARRKYLTGLMHGEADFFDDLVFYQSGSDLAQFRIIFDLRLKLSDGDKGKVRQPTIFSQGDKRLFVTESPDQTNGGKTIRLARRGCGHANGRCKCFKSGLPEVVVPQSAVIEAKHLRVAEVAVVLGKHLEKYVGAGYPGGASLDTVREQKALERRRSA